MAGEGMLTPLQRRAIVRSPAVEKVTDRRIFLCMPFRAHLLACVSRGESPTAVFRAAGLDPKLIGDKRIERVTAHVRGSKPVRDWLERHGDVRVGDPVPPSLTSLDGGDADDVFRILLAVSYRCNALQRQIELLSRQLDAVCASRVPEGSGDVS